MNEKRRATRIADDSELTITIVAGGKKYPKGKIIYNTSKDISVSGAKIQSNMFLPIDTLLKIDFKLKNVQQMISAMGKVKWIKIICEDECYDAGVEFVYTPKEAVKKISNYISWKQNLKSSKLC